jgi:hypothetical protein
MTRATHDRIAKQDKLHHDTCVTMLQDAIDREYKRAMADGYAKVRAWAVEANYNVYQHANPRGAAAAAFQQAAQQFRAEPLTLGEVLGGAPADVKEAIDAVTGS